MVTKYINYILLKVVAALQMNPVILSSPASPLATPAAIKDRLFAITYATHCQKGLQSAVPKIEPQCIYAICCQIGPQSSVFQTYPPVYLSLSFSYRDRLNDALTPVFVCDVTNRYSEQFARVLQDTFHVQSC